MYISVYVCMCVYIFCTYIHILTHMHACVHTYIRMTCMYISVYVCVYILHIHTYIYLILYLYMYFYSSFIIRIGTASLRTKVKGGTYRIHKYVSL